MVSLFNTTAEVSMRVLLVLDTVSVPISKTQLVLLDFAATYSKDFGFTDKNLHGDGKYNMCELAVRNERIGDAIPFLLKNGFISVINMDNGIGYCITSRGAQVCKATTMEYAQEYIQNIQEVQFSILSDDERIMDMINNIVLN